MLDKRLAVLRNSGVPVDTEVETLRTVRARAQEVCFQPQMLAKYREHLHKLGLKGHRKGKTNNLKDVEDEFAKYSFALNSVRMSPSLGSFSRLLSFPSLTILQKPANHFFLF